jgi:LmbE family N-acetylglucosaminyl deacetylase
MSVRREQCTRVAELGTILSIWAHPDDETYLAGGIMAAARDEGQSVVCATATAGERGTPDAGTWPPGRLGPIRRWEAAAAMAVLGVTDHAVAGLPDGDLAGHTAAGSGSRSSPRPAASGPESTRSAARPAARSVGS